MIRPRGICTSTPRFLIAVVYCSPCHASCFPPKRLLPSSSCDGWCFGNSTPRLHASTLPHASLYLVRVYQVYLSCVIRTHTERVHDTGTYHTYSSRSDSDCFLVYTSRVCVRVYSESLSATKLSSNQPSSPVT